METPPADSRRARQGQPSGKQSWLRLLARLRLRDVGYAVAGVTLLISGAFGGLDPVQAKGIQPVVVGQSVVATPVTLTVTGAGWGPDYGTRAGSFGPMTAERAGDGERLVWVEADVRNTSDTTFRLGRTQFTNIFDELIHLRMPGLRENGAAVAAVDGVVDATPSAVVERDTYSRVSTLPPGITYRVAFIWLQDSATPPPTTTTVVINRFTERKNFFMPEMSEWATPETAYSGTLTLTPAPPTPAPSS